MFMNIITGEHKGVPAK